MLFKRKEKEKFKILFENEELKMRLNTFGPKNRENLFDAIEIYYSILMKAEIESRISKTEADLDFEKKMQGLMGFRKYLKWYVKEKGL